MPPISLGIGLSLSMQGKAWRDYDLFETGSGFLYDFSRADTLFQEATGQTSAGLGQNVGLALDISKWGGKTLTQMLAANVVASSDFSSGVDGFTAGLGSVTTVAGELQLSCSATNGYAYKEFVTVPGCLYRASAKLSAVNAVGGEGVLLRAATSGFGNTVSSAPLTSGTGVREVTYLATTTASRFYIQQNSSGAPSIWRMDDFLLQKAPGNHASQVTSAARPVRKAGLTRYDGLDDNLLMTLVPSATMTLAFDYVVPTTLSGVQFIMGAGAGTTRLYAGFNTSGQMIGLVGAQDSSVIKGATDFRGQRVRGFLIADGTTVQLIAGSATEYSAAQNGSNVSAYPMRVGAGNNAGSATGFSNGDLFRALAINRALTPAEITKLTNYWMSH
jgi:hypothetical protein